MSRLIDADALQLAIVEEGQANKRKKYIIGDIWELTGAEIREVINSQPTIQPEITHEQAVEYLQSTGWMQEHDRQMMLDGAHRLTAQPEPHWIPVKEKNPIEYDNPIEFLVTLEDPSGERYIELLMWDGYEWDEIYTDDNELGIWGQDEVIAWCEPLEPYKGVTT